MIDFFLSCHHGFFENDDSNLKTMMAGFVLCVVCLGIIYGLYPL